MLLPKSYCLGVIPEPSRSKRTMIKTSSFLGVRRGDLEWLVYLISDQYWLQSDLGREFTRLLEDVFARDI